MKEFFSPTYNGIRFFVRIISHERYFFSGVNFLFAEEWKKIPYFILASRYWLPGYCITEKHPLVFYTNQVESKLITRSYDVEISGSLT